jgi:hypothetical protein
MVNKAKTLGSKRWADRMLTEHLMRAYTPMNYNMVALICQDPTYKMTSEIVLGRIISHEMYIEEVNHIKNLYKGITTTKKQEIALKASKKSKNKQVVVENSSEEEEEEEEEELKKYMNKKKFSKGDKKFNTKSMTKRICTIVVCMVISLLIALLSVGMMTMIRKRVSSTRRTRATKRVINITRRSTMMKLTLVENGIPMIKTPTLIMMV